MKNMKHHLIIGLVLIMTIALCGCTETTTQNDAQKIIGTWKGIQYYNTTAIMSTYVFSADNIYNITTTYAGETRTINGTWEIKENKFIFTQENQTTTMDYLFSDKGNALTFVFVDTGITLSFIKQ